MQYFLCVECVNSYAVNTVCCNASLSCQSSVKEINGLAKSISMYSACTHVGMQHTQCMNACKIQMCNGVHAYIHIYVKHSDLYRGMCTYYMYTCIHGYINHESCSCSIHSYRCTHTYIHIYIMHA